MSQTKVKSGLLNFPDQTDYVKLPSGTTAQRPVSPDQGFIRYNAETKKVEIYNGNGWFDIGPFYALTSDTTLLTADDTNIKISETTY